MARYIKDFQINVDPQTIHATINQYLQREGYEYIQYDGENVFKKGSGIMSNPTFFKVSYSGNMVRMETWMKYALLPGVYVGELGVKGFVGGAVKGPWKKRISYIENILSNFSPQSTTYPHASAENMDKSFDSNETQLLNDNDRFEETCIMNEDNAKPPVVFCTACGTQMPEGTTFCSVCGQKRINSNVHGAVPQSTMPNQQVFSQMSSFNNFDSTPLPPAGTPVSRKEFINKYAQPSLRKNITSIAILCYVCAGLTFIVSCLLNPFGIIDALALGGLALGMHLAKSKVCAILILVLSIIEVIMSLIVGMFPVWWLVAGILAVVTFSKIDKQYKQFLNR